MLPLLCPIREQVQGRTDTEAVSGGSPGNFAVHPANRTLAALPRNPSGNRFLPISMPKCPKHECHNYDRTGFQMLPRRMKSRHLGPESYALAERVPMLMDPRISRCREIRRTVSTNSSQSQLQFDSVRIGPSFPLVPLIARYQPPALPRLPLATTGRGFPPRK